MKIFPAFLALPLALAACSKHPEHSSPRTEPPPLTTHTRRVEPKPHSASEQVPGTIRAKLRSVIEAKVVGRIESMLARPGQTVKQDELLAQLDSRDTAARLDQARAVLDRAEKDLARTASLLSAKITTQAEYDAAQSSCRVAKATVAEAENNLGNTAIKAPFDGIITRKLADVGDLAAPGKALLEIEDPKLLQFEADVPEALISRIALGAKLPVRAGTLEAEGTVSEIGPAADPQTRTFLVKLDLPQTPGLRAGQFARVAVPLEEASVLRAPAGSVIVRGQMEIAFVIRDGRAALRLVKTGKRIGDEIEILSGVDPGEEVATENVDRLVDGQRVEVSAR